MSNTRKPALGFIFITLLIDVTGFGIIIPVLPKLITEMISGSLSDASKIGGWLLFAFSVMQFIFSPILGNLSDKFGRRPILLFALLGLGFDYVLLAFAPNIGWLFVGRIIAGITGASFTTATAYIADISTPEKRAQNFGMVGAAFGLGFILGPVIGGLLGQYGARIPFFAAAGLTLANVLYGYFILPESLSQENRRPFDWKKANPVSSLLQLEKYPSITGLIVVFVLISIAGHATQSTWTYYTMEKFHWNEVWVGYSLGFVGLMVAIVQGGLIRVISPWLGPQRSVFWGLVLFVIGNVLFAFANQGWMMFAFLVPYCLGGIANPSMQGIISNQVPANEQGELQGVLTSLMSVSSIIGPLVMTNLFAYFTSKNALIYFPGAPFILAGFLTIIGIVIVQRLLDKK